MSLHAGLSPLRTCAAFLSLAASLARVRGACIDCHLQPSVPTAPQVSYVDTSLRDHDRFVLMVDDQPFFYNGIQLRADKLRDVYGDAPAQIAPLYRSAADDGFTVVNTQLFWLDVQPDASFNATQSTDIRGGRFADQNFAAGPSHRVGNQRGNESNQALTYVQFDFTGYADGIDAAKVRFYVDGPALGATAFSASLYGIVDNDWSASSITWNRGAPNHDGVDLAGTEGRDYFLASSSPSWDPVLDVAYYDFDATDFVRNHCPGRVASFVLRADTATDSNNTNNTGGGGDGPIGASVSGARGPHPPRLVLSDQDRFDFGYVDTLLGWAEAAGVKLEFVWFGSDSTGVTMDSRVPYFAFLNTKNEQVRSDGSHAPVFSKNADPAYGTYWYFLDKNDLRTRAQEKRALRATLDHVAARDAALGRRRTLVGVDVANEPAVQKFHGAAFTAWHNPATWAALARFPSVQAFVDRTLWEYCVNLANGVKESAYPVWTRSNDWGGADTHHVQYNEQQRARVGTSLDFVGFDPYSDAFAPAFAFGHAAAYDGKTYALGRNLPVVMENAGSYNTSWGVALATLAGGGLYNVYDYMSSDDLGLYVPRDPGAGDYGPVARGPYVQQVVGTNRMLNKIGRDIASRAPRGAGGTALDYLNVFWNETRVTSSAFFGHVRITYEPSDAAVVGVVDVRGSSEVALLSTGRATYTLSGAAAHGFCSVQSGAYDAAGRWVKNATVPVRRDGDALSFTIHAYQAVRVTTAKAVY